MTPESLPTVEARMIQYSARAGTASKVPSSDRKNDIRDEMKQLTNVLSVSRARVPQDHKRHSHTFSSHTFC
jgi:hypothetical protein